MLRNRRSLILIFVLCAIGAVRAPAHAQAGAQAARECVVEGGQGSCEIILSPSFLTTIYFPEELKGKPLAADQVNFTIASYPTAVVVQPAAKHDAKATTNLNVRTEHLQVSLILRIGATSEAVSQVTVVRKEEKEKFEEAVQAEVAKQTATLKAQLAAEKAELTETIDKRVRTEMAERMLQRFDTKSLDGIERTDDNVVIRVQKAIVVGPDVYVRFNVQNREGLRYVLQAVEVLDGKTPIAAAVTFELPPSDGRSIVGVVEGKEARANGIVVLPVTKVHGRTLTFRFVEEGKGGIKIGGLKVD